MQVNLFDEIHLYVPSISIVITAIKKTKYMLLERVTWNTPVYPEKCWGVFCLFGWLVWLPFFRFP